MATVVNVESQPLLRGDAAGNEDAQSVSSCDSHIEPHFAGAEIVRDVIIG
jgi:hypothetical protein